MNPACFGDVTVHSFGDTCRACGAFGPCTEQVRVVLMSLPATPGVIAAQKAFAAGGGGDEVDTIRAASLPIKVGKQYRRLIASGWAARLRDGLKRRHNPLPFTGFKSLYIAVHLLIKHGQLSRRQLTRAYTDGLGRTVNSAQSEATLICQLLTALELVVDTGEALVLPMGQPETETLPALEGA